MNAPKETNRVRLAVIAALPLAFSTCVEITETSGGSGGACPSDLGGNDCEYYQGGYALGVADLGMGMSMAYERHDGFDSRFDLLFARGYNTGWLENR